MTLEILPGTMFAKRTTLRLGGDALAEIRVAEIADLDDLPRALAQTGGRPLALGRGSNILALDGELQVAVVSQTQPGGPQAVGESNGKIMVRAHAALKLPVLRQWLEKRGLWGLHGLAGIPGELGGAIAMNAGSWGCEMAGVLRRVRIWSEETGLVWLEPEQWKTGYRKFEPRGVTGFYMICEAEMAFEPRAPEEVYAAAKEALTKKKAVQPLKAASAGCVFRNPEGHSAGKLLDELGFKGKRVGDMAFSDMHANFLVNLGQGTSAQALELIESATEAVQDAHGIRLELEVKVVA